MKTSSAQTATLVEKRKRPYAKRESVKRKVAEADKDNSIPAITGENTAENRKTLPEAFLARRFQPGVSGNPSGRPAGTSDLRKYAREFTFEAIDILKQIARDVNASSSSRVLAVGMVLDRGHGKAVQPVEHGGVGAFEGKTEAEMMEYLAQRLPLLGLPAPQMIDVTPQK